jgi:hypothetical protein
VGVTPRAASSVASLAQGCLEAVSRGGGIAAAARYFRSEVVYIVNGPSTLVGRSDRRR